jgi:hypothetical protein
MTTPKTPNTEVDVNELSFPRVTLVVLSEERFGSYRLSRQVTMLNCFGQIGHWNEIPALGA